MPSFFEHFDGAVVDWKYLRERGPDILMQEAGWSGRQKLRLFVDLTSALNFYPFMRLLDDRDRFDSSSMAAMEDVPERCQLFGHRT